MKRHIIFGLVVATIILLWGASWYFVPKLYDAQSLEAGTFGDMFGAVNALFSGLAFAGLIYTITVQRQELTLQREAIKMQTEELKLQREETARSADQLEGQKYLLNFETAMRIVDDLLKKRIERLGAIIAQTDTGRVIGLSALKSMVRNKNIPESNRYIQDYLNITFYILQLISIYELTGLQRKVLYDMLEMVIQDVEIEFIVRAIDDENLLGLLKSSGLYERYELFSK
ncbi:hypothetical protein MHB85_19250 [Paenibacillus sp. FSL K6-4396]|uniref:hypothetical protein n=1 Tax=Paenibacillus sp. FSL K6-4396 TaxID=2921506 RepID=UPI0030F77E5B